MNSEDETGEVTSSAAYKYDPESAAFWKAKSKRGRKPIFASPQELEESCEEYFEWVKDHPLSAAELVKFQGDASLSYVPKMRAMTITGLCIFLDISMVCWRDYKNRPEFASVCTRVEDVIRTQKFEGASADLLNHAIIARDLGLRDATETVHSGSIGITDLSNEALEQRILEIMAGNT